MILVDTRRLADCFAAIDYFEQSCIPFLIAANHFDGAPGYDPDEIRDALDLDPGTPVLLCDAHQRDSVKQVLTTLVRHTIGRNRANSEAREGRCLPDLLSGFLGTLVSLCP